MIPFNTVCPSRNKKSSEKSLSLGERRLLPGYFLQVAGRLLYRSSACKTKTRWGSFGTKRRLSLIVRQIADIPSIIRAKLDKIPIESSCVILVKLCTAENCNVFSYDQRRDKTKLKFYSNKFIVHSGSPVLAPKVLIKLRAGQHTLCTT